MKSTKACTEEFLQAGSIAIAGLAAGTDQQTILKNCIFMFIEPVRGLHAFHRSLNKTFGLYPGNHWLSEAYHSA